MTVYVYDFDSLKSAVTDNVSTDIRLIADIVYTPSNNIIIPKTKGDITIDGQGFTITDNNTSSNNYLMRVVSQAGPPITVTVKNVIWQGRCYYGIVYVPDSETNSSNVTLLLDNVEYCGPQPIHNRAGITHIKNSSFDLALNGATYISYPEEFCEGNRLIIEGSVSITKLTSEHSIIWFTNENTSLTIKENALLTITAPETYFIYNSTASAQPALLFERNSRTNITTKYGLFYAASQTLHIASSFRLCEHAEFRHIQTHRRNSTLPSFKCRNSFILEEGSLFHLFMPSSGSSALMYFGNVSDLSFNNPKSVVLYNNGGNVFQFASGSSGSPNTIGITAELLNRWTNATTPADSAGGFDDPPNFPFSKENGDNITVSIQSSSSAITSITSNIQSGDSGYPLTSSTFNIFASMVISMGNLLIEPDEIKDNSHFITGITEPFAALRASYSTQTIPSSADSTGSMNIELPAPIPAETNIVIGANRHFLTKFIQRTAVGHIEISYLSDLDFKCFVSPNSDELIKRKNPAWYLEITDTRTEGGDWYLYASLPEPLHTDTDSLENGPVFIEESEENTLSATPILIKHGVSSPPAPSVTRLTWSEWQGFLLRVRPDICYHAGNYLSLINWSLYDSPSPEPE